MSLLPTVLHEIAQKLIAGDWIQMLSNDGKSYYYIIGAESYNAVLSDEVRFNTMALPDGSGRATIGPIGEFKTRSQVAGSHPDYLKLARKRLEESGVPPNLIDRLLTFLSSNDDYDRAAGAELNSYRKSSPQIHESLMQFIDAYRVQLHGDSSPMDLSPEEELEVGMVREKLCLQELVAKYGKIVDKWEQLDELPFEEPLLEEATKAYLYGFYRAAVMLSASALEHNLKRAIGVKSFDRTAISSTMPR